ncbi:hypothetical protein AVEN_154986-1 [Araneus ventricosus]|uniref:Uncharacterized protein n=1 Tax=Araneus ventricosus TaxID=182803 RepID=A0A4Y2A8M4_ARAVE|nr:hypothetical protein AVEN_154986-1 [Araneus ventricosus]
MFCWQCLPMKDRTPSHVPVPGAITAPVPVEWTWETNERQHIRELGYRRILKARQIVPKKKTVTNFVPTKINFQASDYIEIINWNFCAVYLSPMLRDLR